MTLNDEHEANDNINTKCVPVFLWSLCVVGGERFNFSYTLLSYKSSCPGHFTTYLVL